MCVCGMFKGGFGFDTVCVVGESFECLSLPNLYPTFPEQWAIVSLSFRVADVDAIDPAGRYAKQPSSICYVRQKQQPASDPNQTQIMYISVMVLLTLRCPSRNLGTMGYSGLSGAWAVMIGHCRVAKASLLVDVFKETLLLSSLTTQSFDMAKSHQPKSRAEYRDLLASQLEMRMETEFRCLAPTTLHNPSQQPTEVYTFPERWAKTHMIKQLGAVLPVFCIHRAPFFSLICFHYLSYSVNIYMKNTWKNSLADPTQKFDAIQVCSCVSQRLLWREKLRKIVLKYPTRTTSHFSGIGWSNNPKTGTVVSAEQPERMFFEQEDLGVVQHPSPDGMGWEPGRSRSGNNIEFTLRLFKVRKCS